MSLLWQENWIKLLSGIKLKDMLMPIERQENMYSSKAYGNIIFHPTVKDHENSDKLNGIFNQPTK